eukprot:CAMPEP_0175504922 /NCGR_PEP_ID=MMETSP0096-20121207/8584_1 /TAXON_ID=311494 /ORGANISM="Alexandrium monilatum, Strain CCMP3105" /LENGTH=57 /DNA_ID=CAMNT_0016807005 /DNA_START=93 /DNA_END=262 /DNA_ORIENTATION=-
MSLVAVPRRALTNGPDASEDLLEGRDGEGLDDGLGGLGLDDGHLAKDLSLAGLGRGL